VSDLLLGAFAKRPYTTYYKSCW